MGEGAEICHLASSRSRFPAPLGGRSEEWVGDGGRGGEGSSASMRWLSVGYAFDMNLSEIGNRDLSDWPSDVHVDVD